MTVSIASKITMGAVAIALVSSACGAGSAALGMNPSDAASSSAQQVSPALGSSLQDMQDLYALKRQVAALRREQPAISGSGCDVRDQ
jgi:hypothetical protein